MFEILSVLIVYARGSLEDRLKVMFKLYCFEEEDSMQLDEFKFMFWLNPLHKESCLVRDGKNCRNPHFARQRTDLGERLHSDDAACNEGVFAEAAGYQRSYLPILRYPCKRSTASLPQAWQQLFGQVLNQQCAVLL